MKLTLYFLKYMAVFSIAGYVAGYSLPIFNNTSEQCAKWDDGFDGRRVCEEVVYSPIKARVEPLTIAVCGVFIGYFIAEIRRPRHGIQN